MLINNSKRVTRKSSKMKQYHITYDMIARWFNYSNPQSFNGSRAKRDMIKDIESIIIHMEEQFNTP